MTKTKTNPQQLSIIMGQLLKRAKLNPNLRQTAKLPRGLNITCKYHKGLMGVQLSRPKVWPSDKEVEIVVSHMPPSMQAEGVHSRKEFGKDGVNYIQLYFEVE